MTNDFVKAIADFIKNNSWIVIAGFVFTVSSLIFNVRQKMRGSSLTDKYDGLVKEKEKINLTLKQKKRDLAQQQETMNLLGKNLGQKDTELDTLKETLQSREKEVADKEQKLADMRRALEDSDGNVWRAHTPQAPAGYNDRITSREPLILTVANMKGGVGKTTVSSNLAAFFSHKMGKRVLLIDLDYQGSLSGILLSSIGRTEHDTDRGKSVEKLLLNEMDGGNLSTSTIPLAHKISDKLVMQGCCFVPAFYNFIAFENRLQSQWLLGEVPDDIRYRMATKLLSDEAKSLFDVIIIDTPPRLTTGTINALCASTHLLVPTVLDSISVEAAITFLDITQKNLKPLNPALELAGIVGTLTYQQGKLQKWEDRAKIFLEERMPHVWKQSGDEWKGIFNQHIPRRAALAYAAGRNIGYFTDKDKVVPEWFDTLGGELVKRMGWQNEDPTV